MNNTIKIGDKEMIELSEEDVSKYHLLGRGVGESLEYCIYMGQKNVTNFFQRLVAYRITESKESKTMNDALNNNSNVNETIRNTHYIAVEFYELIKKEKMIIPGSIPDRLNSKHRPELNDFPYNILLTWEDNDNNNITVAVLWTLYEPNFESYAENGYVRSMKYYHTEDSRCWIKIEFNFKTKSYFGARYLDDQCIGVAEGTSWDEFFVRLTQFRLGKFHEDLSGELKSDYP